MISIKNIVKKYGDKPIIDNVSLDIPEGKVIAFIGSNGAGKSTLLSIISRTLSKNEGEVFIDEKELSKWDSTELAKKISILKQSNNLNIRLTVYELVSFGRFPYSKGRLTKEDKVYIENAIKYMEIEHLKDRFLDELSGGQKQMAFIAMIIAQDTQYIFLDEPLNNLDMHHSVQIMKNIRKLADEMGKTVIVVIHDINFVSLYADHIIAMKDGKVIKNSSRDDVIKEPILKEIYGMDIQVKEVDGKNICLYYS